MRIYHLKDDSDTAHPCLFAELDARFYCVNYADSFGIPVSVCSPNWTPRFYCVNYADSFGIPVSVCSPNWTPASTVSTTQIRLVSPSVFVRRTGRPLLLCQLRRFVWYPRQCSFAVRLVSTGMRDATVHRWVSESCCG
ncbi:unnamed protein product, partial [Iphiclides podalirius]